MKNFFQLLVLLPGIFLLCTAATVRLAWDAPADPTVTHYRVYKSVFGSDFEFDSETSVLFNFLMVPGLLETGTYKFHVVSANAAGVESVPSNVVEYEVPITRPVLNVVEIAAGRVRLGWRHLWTNEAWFEMEKSLDGGKTFETYAWFPPWAQHVNDFDVEKNGTFHYRLRVWIGDNPSEFSRVVSAYAEK